MPKLWNVGKGVASFQNVLIGFAYPDGLKEGGGEEKGKKKVSAYSFIKKIIGITHRRTNHIGGYNRVILIKKNIML